MIRTRRRGSLFIEQLEGRVLLSGDGLLGQYFDNSNFTNAAATRVDPTVDFNWGSAAPMAGMGADTFSVRWTGQVEAKFTETYTFHTTSDDGVRLWVNGQRLINNWSDHTATTNTGTIALEAGKRYDIRLEYYDNTSAATMRLLWSSPSQPMQVIPQASLSSTPATPVVDLPGNAADRMIRADGLLAPVNNTNMRVGMSTQYQSSVMVFQLPQLPAGQTLAGAELQVYFEGKNGTPTFNVDLYGLGARSTPTVNGSDYFAGTFGADATDAAALVDNMVTPTSWVKQSILNNSVALRDYLINAYQSAGAGSYVFLRLSPDSTLVTGDRFYIFSSADVGPMHLRPHLKLILDDGAPAVPAPSAPTGVAGTPISDKQVDLTWNDTSANESGFRIERSTDGVNFTVIAETPANAQSYTDAAGLLASTTYHYRLSSFNVGGATPAPVIQVTTLAPPPPPPPSSNGLLAKYYDHGNFSTLVATRVDPTVDFNWGTAAPLPGMGVDTFSVRWTGQVEAKYSQTYTFHTSSDDGVRLWIDGKLIISNWSDHTATTNTGTIALQAGQRYDLRMDYYDNTGAATARLSWSSASQPLQVIPQASLYSTPVLPILDVTGHGADRMIRADGLLAPVSNTNVRVGLSTQYQSSVMVFQLPELPAGQTLAGAEFQVYYENRGGSPTFNVDLYGLGARSTPTVNSSDYFAGNFGGDATDATALVDNLLTPSTPIKSSILTSNAALTAYLNSAYQTAGAGSYVFLRLSPDSTLVTNDRYYTLASGDVWPLQVRPQLRLVLAESGPTVPAPSAPTGVAGTPMSDKQVYLTWTDTSANEDGFRIERSTDGVNFTVVAETPANTQSYTDAAGLLASTSYHYRLSSFNAGGATPAPVISALTLPTFTKYIFVDDNANPTGADGTFFKPYATIKAGLAPAVAGNGVIVREGVYREAVTMKSGAAGAPLTLMGMPGERAVVTGAAVISGWQSIGNGLYTTTLNWQPKDFYVGYEEQRVAQDPVGGGWKVITSVSGSTVTDSVNLVNYPHDIVGGTLQIWRASGNTIVNYVITAQDKATGTLTLASPSSLAAGDKYIIRNQPELITQPGQWSVESVGGGNYKMTFRPVNVADLEQTQALRESRRVILANNVHYAKIHGLEVTGSANMGIEVNGGSSNIEVTNNIIHNNGGNGLNFRITTNILAARNIIFSNSTGLAVISTNGGIVEENEIAMNTADGLIIAGDISGSNSNPKTYNVVARRNYVHHHLLWAHPDNSQMYRGVYDVKLLDNLMIGAGQVLMTEEVDGGELAGNVFLGSSAYLLIFGHSNSNNWSIHNNTVGMSGYGIYNFSATGFDVRENITLGSVTVGNPTTVGYTSDRNLYWRGSPTDTILTVSSPKWTNYTTVEAFYAATGQEQNGKKADPLLTNYPVNFRAAEKIHEATLTSLKLRGGTGGFAVGDNIEINFDGVVRKITAVDAVSISFDKALPALPMRDVVVANWGSKTDHRIDVTPLAGSPALTMGASGGQIGSKVNVQQYMAGDFDGDGKRDLPTLPAGLKMPDPNNPISPSF